MNEALNSYLYTNRGTNFADINTLINTYRIHRTYSTRVCNFVDYEYQIVEYFIAAG